MFSDTVRCGKILAVQCSMEFCNSVLGMTECERIKKSKPPNNKPTPPKKQTNKQMKPYNQTSIYYFINSKHFFGNYITILVMSVPKVTEFSES